MVPRSAVLSLFCLLFAFSPASADFSTGSTGADGAFHPTSNDTIDLSLAGSGPGSGTYDPVHWAVVFNYTTIDVPANVTVAFKNHPSGAPVVWLATGDVNVSGTVSLNGERGSNTGEAIAFARPGPGGFEGGRAQIDAAASRSCAGLGPGGAPRQGPNLGAGGGYGSAGIAGSAASGGTTYGDEYVLPLIGGSGGSGGNTIYLTTSIGGGGAGGGAILIASPTAIVLNPNSRISANGGAGGMLTPQGYAAGGPGSGGAIRLRAPSVTGSGLIRAHSGSSGPDLVNGLGRIRAEATYLSLADVGVPTLVASTTPNPIFPDSNAPTLRATLIDTTAVPADPLAGIASIDAVVADVGMVTLQIEATNIDPETVVKVILVPDGDTRTEWSSAPLQGTFASSTATATFPLDRIRRTEMILRAETSVGPVTRAMPAAGAR